MILGGKLPGKVGRCRFEKSRHKMCLLFLLLPFAIERNFPFVRYGGIWYNKLIFVRKGIVMGMKSVKPGRGPSAMGAAASIFAVLFGCIWTGVAVSSGAPWFFALFGILFIVMAAVQGIYNFKNATGKARYSSFDIVDAESEPDPLNEYFGEDRERKIENNADTEADAGERRFCPYCGAGIRGDFRFCAKCGRELPDWQNDEG